MNFGKSKASSEDISNYGDLLRLNLWKYFQQDRFESSEHFNAVQAILQRNQDVVISMPPGSGRSLCYQLAGLMQENKVTIVFCPIKLIKHQLDQLRKHKIGAESPNCHTGSKREHRQVVINDLKTETPNTRFLYVTPQLASSKSFLNDVESLYQDNKLAYFAVEEAHSISHLGHFQKEYLNLGSFRSAYPSIPWIAVAEIAPKVIVDDIVEHLQLYKPIAWFKTPCENIFCNNLYYDVVFEKFDSNNFIQLKEYVKKCLGYIDYHAKKNTKPCGIIFCRTTEICERVASGLTEQGIITMPHHERLSSIDRRKNKVDWLSGVFPVISTTSSLSKEIYKSSVRFVVHCEVPESVTSYYQESRQAGRDGRSSYCRIYYDRKTVQTIDLFFKNKITNSSDQIQAKRDYDDFLKMCIYCESMECRHKLFSDYFQDVSPECTNRCDVCKNPKKARNALDNFQLYSDAYFSAPTRVQDDDFCDGNQSSTSCENANNGQKSIQSKNVSNPFIQQQLTFLSTELESTEKDIPLSTWKRKRRRAGKKKIHNLLEAFLQLHHRSSLNTAESSEQAAAVSESSPPTLDGFHKIQEGQTKTSEIGVSSNLIPAQIEVNEEPRSGVQIDLHNFDRISLTFNGQSMKLNPSSLQLPTAPSASCEVFRMKTKRSRSRSPTNSIIKEEKTDNLQVSELNGRTDLFGSHARYPRTVSPAETIIKEEYDEVNEYCKDTVGVMIDNKTSLRNDFFGLIPRPPRNLSPAETIIKEENVLPVVPNACVEQFSSRTNSIVKIEPTSSPIIIDRPSGWLSGPENARHFHPQIDRSVSPSFMKREQESIATISTSTSTSTSKVYNNVFTQNNCFSDINATDTIIKRERASPEINSNYSTERQENFLENFSENYVHNCTPLEQHRTKIKCSPRGRQPSKTNDQHSNVTRSDEGEKSHKRDQDDIHRHEPQHKRQRKEILSNNDFDNRNYNQALRKSTISPDSSELKNIVITENMVNKLQPALDRKEHVFHGLIKQIETKYQGQQMPLHLLNMLKTEKSLIAELVKTSLKPYYQAGKIQPKDFFSVVARKISHIFYDRYADEFIIKKYIDDLFTKITIITSIRDLECNL